MGDLLAQVGLGGLLHLAENHGRDLLGSKSPLSLASSLHLDMRFGALLDNLENYNNINLELGIRARFNSHKTHLKGVEFDVVLDGLIGPLSANQPLSIKDGVLGVAGQLVLGGVPDQSLSLGSEGHVARGDSVSLVIGDDLNTAVLEYSHTGKGKL